MPEFYVTFQQRFRREPHPRLAEAHPDGWLVIEAPSYGRAKRAADDTLGEHDWSMLYQVPPDRNFFPRGELGRFGAK